MKLNKRNLKLEDDKLKDVKGGKKLFGKNKFRNQKFKGKISNPPEHHMKNPEMVKNVASIPFNHMGGFPLPIDNADISSATVSTQDVNIQYLRSFIYDWFAGRANDFRSIINQASTELWNFIRGRNSGATNYQPSDILISTVLAATDIACNIVNCERAFKYHKKFTSANRLYPKLLFTAMGIDYDDFVANLQAYRFYFNNIVSKACSMVIPNEFPIIQQAMLNYSEIYKDRDTDTGREQLYIKVKAFHHVYDPTTYDTGGAVRLMNVQDLYPSLVEAGFESPLFTGDNGNEPIKFSVLLSILDLQINRLIMDEDVNIMFGDFIKAFGDSGNFLHFNELPDDITGDFVYSEEILEQIHNSNPLPYQDTNVAVAKYTTASTPIYDVMGNEWQPWYYTPFTFGPSPHTYKPRYSNVIKQDANNHIVTELSFRFLLDDVQAKDVNEIKVKLGSNSIIDTNFDNPDPVRVMNMTRCTNRFLVETDGSTSSSKTVFKAYPEAVSSNILFDQFIYQVTEFSPNAPAVITRIPARTYMSGVIGTNSNLSQADVVFLCANTLFDWAPIVLVLFAPAGGTTFEPYLLGDINNVTTIQPADLERIHQVDYLSLFNVPRTR